MLKILIFDSGQPFTLETLDHQPLGGSEISILLLAKGLAELGNSVVLLNTTKTGRQNLGRLQLDHVSFFDEYAKLCDIILFNRIPAPTFRNHVEKIPMYIWCHDAYDQHNCKWMLNADPTEYFEKVFFVSKWQKITCQKYLNFNTSNSYILPNCIDPHINYNASIDKNPKRLIFASVPYKGLEVMGDIFKEVCFRSKIEDLELHLYSSMSLYSSPEKDEDWNNIFAALKQIPNVYVHNTISYLEMNKEFARSGLLIHPVTYHETFGRVFIEAMLNGCIPVTLNNGANKEVIKGNGYIVDQPNIFYQETFNKFVDKIIYALNDKKIDVLRNSGKMRALDFDYVRVAKTFLNYMELK